MMAEQVNIDRIIMQVMDNVTQVVEEQERLNEVKQILYMCLSRYLRRKQRFPWMWTALWSI